LDLAKQGRAVLLNVPTLRDVHRFAEGLRKSGWDNFQALDAETAQTLGEEAYCIEKAGRRGFITISSKIAARGADIKLDADAMEAGGLFVVGLERGADRRYDTQLQGRAGRHGSPGDSRFFVSLEDELMLMFSADRISGIMRHLGMEEDVPIESPFVTRQIASAQRRRQRRESDERLQVVEIDDILSRHRIVFYAIRQKILTKVDLMPELDRIIGNWVEFRGRTVAEAKGRAFGKSADVRNRLGPLGRFFDQIELDRILQVQKRQQRSGMLGETLRRKVQGSPFGSMGAERQNSILRSKLLSFLDNRWKGYLRFEETTRDEMSLSWPDPSSLERYASKMEDHFDSFFLDVGEQTIASVLEFVKWNYIEIEKELS
jgi:preprotein translocase subunit SecA